MGQDDSLVVFLTNKSHSKEEIKAKKLIYYKTVSIIEEIYDKILFTQLNVSECDFKDFKFLVD